MGDARGALVRMGGPSEIHPASLEARARAEVDHPVRLRHDVEVVLDHDHRPPSSTNRSSRPMAARPNPPPWSSSSSTYAARPGPADDRTLRARTLGSGACEHHHGPVTMRHFALAAGSQLVAEGIETDAELATLRELMVPLGQGYLLGRPQPAGG